MRKLDLVSDDDRIVLPALAMLTGRSGLLWRCYAGSVASYSRDVPVLTLNFGWWVI
jgi:hypothetical protein